MALQSQLVDSRASNGCQVLSEVGVQRRAGQQPANVSTRNKSALGTRDGDQVRDGPAVDGDAQTLPSLNLAQHATDIVAQLALRNRPHVGTVADVLRRTRTTQHSTGARHPPCGVTTRSVPAACLTRARLQCSASSWPCACCEIASIHGSLQPAERQPRSGVRETPATLSARSDRQLPAGRGGASVEMRAQVSIRRAETVVAPRPPSPAGPRVHAPSGFAGCRARVDLRAPYVPFGRTLVVTCDYVAGEDMSIGFGIA